MLRIFGLLAAAASLLLAAALVGRSMQWKSQVDRTQAAVNDFAHAIEEYHARRGHLPGDANRDGRIDDAESAHVARRLWEAGLIASGPTTIALNGRVVALSLIARGERNVIELSNLPPSMAQDIALPSIPGVAIEQAHAAGGAGLAAQ